MKQIKEVDGLRDLFIITSLILLIPVVAYGEETSSDIDVRVDSVVFYFMRTFSAESPVYSIDPTHGWRSFSSFRFNETYRSRMLAHYIELNKSGIITFKEKPRAGYIHFAYKDRPDTRIIINSHYIWVVKRFDDSNLTMGEFKKIYEDLRDFVFNNISTNRFCFESPPDAEYNRFCPFIKQSGKYQRARWTILIEFKNFSPDINDENLESFQKFHPLYFIREIKTVKESESKNNYLFYYASPRFADSILIYFKPTGDDTWDDLLPYLELTEIIFAKAEQQKLMVKKEIEKTNLEINFLKRQAYSTYNPIELWKIQKNLSNLTFINSTIANALNELNTLEREEYELLLEEEGNIFHKVYLGKIETHNDLFSRDLETLMDAFNGLKSDRDEALALVESKLQALASIVVAILAALVIIYLNNKTNRDLKESIDTQTEKMEELTQRQIHSFRYSYLKMIKKLKELTRPSKKK